MPRARKGALALRLCLKSPRSTFQVDVSACYAAGTYAHFSLLTDAMDVHTLAKQMGTSVKMIEQHYGHIAPAMKADVIAGERMGKRRVAAEQKTAATTAPQQKKPKLRAV